MSINTELLQPYQEDFVLLLEAGFTAINQADGTSANALFAATALLKPDNCISDLGKAYVLVHALQLQEANAILERVLRNEPNQPMAQGLLALSYALVPGTQEKSKEIAGTLEKSKDPYGKELATSVLNLVHHFEEQAASRTEEAGRERIQKRAASARARREKRGKRQRSAKKPSKSSEG